MSQKLRIFAARSVNFISKHKLIKAEITTIINNNNIMNKRLFNQQNLTRRLRLLSVLFAMLLMPIGAWAEDYPLIVAGVQVTDENATDITGTGITTGTVSFTPAGDTTPATLTLEGANLTEGITTSINGLVIDLIGDNTITSSTQAPIKGTGDTEPTLTLKSSGTTVGSLKLIPTEASNYP